jgi:uncharacterized repeat protein (TIGR03803 family)
VVAACSSQSTLPTESPGAPAPSSASVELARRFQEQIIYDFQAPSPYSAVNPGGPLFRGADGGLYGPSYGYPGGYIVELTPQRSLRIVHDFKDASYGTYPSAVVGDAAGNLYGTTFEGGDTRCLGGLGCGTAFELSPSGTSYVIHLLHVFEGGTDGIAPDSLTLSANGALYGETAYGGSQLSCSYGCGTVFRLTRKGGQSLEGGQYRETILHFFQGGSDGVTPSGPIVSDSRGDLFGVTRNGGAEKCPDTEKGCGTVYELARHGSVYEEKVLYRFIGAKKGAAVPTSIIRSSDGILYGVTYWGGNPSCQFGCGTVFKLVASGSEYLAKILTQFGPAPGRAAREPSQLLLWKNELYGTTGVGGTCNGGSLFPHGCGTAFAVDLATRTTKVIHDFKGPPNDGTAPSGGGFIAGSDGSLYGVTVSGGTGGLGTIYRLSP